MIIHPENKKLLMFFRLLKFFLLFYFAGFIYFFIEFIKNKDYTNLLPLCIFSYFMMRIAYEVTFSKNNSPTISTGFFERGAVAAQLKSHAANFPDGYTVIDLGSGSGSLTRRIANTIPFAKVVGVELGKIPFLQAKWLATVFGFKNLSYVQGDLLKYDCRHANAVVMFLSAGLTQQAGEKLYHELAEGSLVIANAFELRGQWNPPEKKVFNRPFPATLYIYRR